MGLNTLNAIYRERFERELIIPWAPGVTWHIGENAKDGQYLKATFPDGYWTLTSCGHVDRPSIEGWADSTVWVVWQWINRAPEVKP